MKTYIVLLRGINVGGHKKMPMAELRNLLTKAGFNNVKTYIQSGNVILETLEKDSKILETRIQQIIANHFNFEVPVLVKTREELNHIFNNCPFLGIKKETSYFFLLQNTPSEDLIKIASEKKYKEEEYKITKDCIYLFCNNGYGKAKFNANFFEQKLETSATSRNYKTMVKLLSLSE